MKNAIEFNFKIEDEASIKDAINELEQHLKAGTHKQWKRFILIGTNDPMVQRHPLPAEKTALLAKKLAQIFKDIFMNLATLQVSNIYWNNNDSALWLQNLFIIQEKKPVVIQEENFFSKVKNFLGTKEPIVEEKKLVSPLRELVLADNEFDSNISKVFHLILPHLTSLKRLILGGNHFNADDLKRLLLAQNSLNELEELSLNGNPIGNSGLQVIANWLHASKKKLKVLRILGCQINDLTALTTVLSVEQKLTLYVDSLLLSQMAFHQISVVVGEL